jgi:hypothetical protein
MLAVVAAVLLVLVPPQGAGVLCEQVQAVPVTVDATGGTDVTGALNEAIARLPAGGRLELAAGGRYRVDGTLVVAGRSDLTIDGNGATIVAGTEGDQERAHLSIERSARITVTDVRITGANPVAGTTEPAYRVDRAFQHGIRILSSSDVDVDRVVISDVFGDFVYIGQVADGEWSSRVHVRRSVLVRNGRQGIAVTAGRDVVIEGNLIGETRRATIDLEPGRPEQGAENVHIVDNTIGPGRLRFLAAHGNGPVNQVVVARNVLHRSLQIDVEGDAHLDRRSGLWIIDNESRLPFGDTPIDITRMDGLVVRDNTQVVDEEGAPGVRAEDVCGTAVTGNQFGDAPPIAQTGGRCDTPPVPDPPPRPGITGPAGAGVSCAPPTTTTTAPPPTSTTDGPTDAAAADDPTAPVGGTSRTVGVVVAGAAAAVGLVAASSWAVARRARRG